MPSFILRKLDPEFWARVQAKAKAEGTTPKAVILRLLAAWLGVVTLGVLLSACAPPLAPSPVTVTPVQIPTALSLTASGATSASESVLNFSVSDATGKGVPGETVFVSTTAGTLAGASVVTSQNGTAQLMLRTTRNATITAQVRGLTTTVDATAYRAPEPPVFPPNPPPAPPPPPPATCATDPTLCPVTPAPAGLVVTLTCTAVAHPGPSPCNVNVSYNGTPLPATAISSVGWNWGDGDTNTTAVPVMTHSYLNAGSYTVFVSVTATTNEGVKTATASRPLTIL